jgi:Sec-independent protein secretion pathway component TatC
LLLAVPLWLLFELGVLLGTVVGGKRPEEEAPVE